MQLQEEAATGTNDGGQTDGHQRTVGMEVKVTRGEILPMVEPSTPQEAESVFEIAKISDAEDLNPSVQWSERDVKSEQLE